NSMDFGLGQLRPKHKARAIDLIESVTNASDTARDGAGYQKTGDLITLPYTEVVMTEQPYATRAERVNPVLVSSWVGSVELSPSSDTWFETEVLPDLVVNEEGDYDAVLAQEANNLGTVWNSWQTQWSGVVETRVDNWIEGGTQFRPDRFDVTRTTETVRTDQTRTGVNTQVDLRVDRVSQGLRVVSQNAIPVVRSKTITFTGVRFKPKTRLFAFFDKQDVNDYCTPGATEYTSSAYTYPRTGADLLAGDPLITNGYGKIEGTFLIPDPKVDGNPTFPTGTIVFRLTSSEHNGVPSTEQRPGTTGEALYSSSGMLETQQETITATRNATVTRTGQSQETSFNTVTSNDIRRASGNWTDEQNILVAMRAETAAARAEAVAATASAAAADARAAEARRVADAAAARSLNIILTGDDDGGDGGDDPLAQTFKIGGSSAGITNGAFITSVDLYFQAVDVNVPITVELRNVVNGYPGPKVLPFGRVTKN
ncbi:MAG: DUF4815 domain-containing protein, partial [Anaerolineales bacterium]|nr:DUF4815 domain-containing protein [Anaerolineales bacterium]